MRTCISLLFLILIGSCSSNSEDNTKSTTPINPNPPNPNTYTDNEVMDRVQKESLKYFWDFAHPISKLARERYHTDDPGNDADIITTGGSGFGIMTLLIAINRGQLPRADAVGKLQTMLAFLENADRFHGAWPHWMNGNTGKVIPFGNDDNGGDLVETSFLCQAFICIREFFKNSTDTNEKNVAQKADDLWKAVEWNWYTKGGENVLYWHWSPNFAWQKNFKLEGYNECLITYVMAAASPTYPINKTVYTEGWTRNGTIANGSTQFGLPVVVNHNGATGSVGPLFWAHYSFLGLDPRGLSDTYTHYGNAVQNHAKINVEYAKANSKGFGYSDKIWGLTASYTRNANGTTGYNAHSIVNDIGVISPTAALSSMPYTPTESLKFLHYLYEEKAATLIGIAGPYDAFSIKYNWVTPRYLAIDQGTISPMIENYRTQFLWKLFMNAPEIKQGLIKLGFHSSQYGF